MTILGRLNLVGFSQMFANFFFWLTSGTANAACSLSFLLLFLGGPQWNQISTPHLAMMNASFFNEFLHAANMGCFVVFFVLFRGIICPYLWYSIIVDLYQQRNSDIPKACQPWHFAYVSFTFGMFFNCLNGFWMYKLFRKIRRKYLGTEKLREKNDLKTGKQE